MVLQQIEFYMVLLATIATIGILFRDSTLPLSLLLVVTGMLMGFLPIPRVIIHPDIILDLFLPLLLYEASGFSVSWRDTKANLRPIALLSIGHVVFITMLVAVTIHTLIPEFGWPLSFILGAVVSPPDDVAILSIADKIPMPSRILAILKGEAMFNDAAALTIYRFALLALLTHQFSIANTIGSFFLILIGETLYGLFIGYLMGGIRLLIRDSSLMMVVSLLTPFLAYIPAERMGGTGVIATVVAGFYIGNNYWSRYSPDSRLSLRAIWLALSFAVQSILFLLVGLNFHYTIDNISDMPTSKLMASSIAVILAVILGRFFWVYAVTYLPQLFSPSLRIKDQHFSWKETFIISWAGMRGGISLAAALAVPVLPAIAGVHPREFLIFLVFGVIVTTLLVQGMTLPWILRLLGTHDLGRAEITENKRTELKTRIAMTNAALRWLTDYESKIIEDKRLLGVIKQHIQDYQKIENKLSRRLSDHSLANSEIDQELEAQYRQEIYLLTQIIEIERQELMSHWRDNKINQLVRTRLEQQLDLRAKHCQAL